MLALQSYLRDPRVRKILNKKPGQEGFSLIELVVVVAVLAILAAVAIPSFTSLNAEARVAGAKTTLANVAKECAVKIVDSDPANTYTNANYQPNGYAALSLVGAGSLGTCAAADHYQLVATNNDLPTFRYNAGTGAKTCSNGSAGGANAALGCSAGGTW